ncbi:low-specificity L-threonine aldolase [Gallaecimonas kandeliae]|uniref:low-specificity L-threonine aldolase n=1 Tax=Gallaecimonas kandeliae TaxID=3029055 RepID=UPI0026489C53|nr:low-specificity L-threonine aldolase [Gallaecimonas kandeliae]WKE66887.1 low-specificity L-threonine aldolase [Gallaecimonas kandeliae]
MIDFRSDTVTQPTDEMRQAMALAQVGDDVYGDDPTVNALEAFACDKLGFEAGLFTSSGTQANLLALMSHCDRGDEYLCGQQAHNYKYEAGGAAVLGSIQPQPIDNEPDGSLALDKLEAAIKADDFHFARTRLVSLENTIGGKVLGLDYQAQVAALCKARGLKLHLDGARAFNAAVALDVDIKAITRHYDSVSICLSKGLGAPIGSLLMGDAEFIARARRLRKMVGGGMRQAGIIAAAAHIALDKMPGRLKEDHDHAALLAERLAAIGALTVTATPTNILYARCNQGREQALKAFLQGRGILITAGKPMRFVTHLGIKEEDVELLAASIGEFYRCH